MEDRVQTVKRILDEGSSSDSTGDSAGAEGGSILFTDSADFLPNAPGNGDDDSVRSFSPKEKVDTSIQTIRTGGPFRVPTRTSLALDRSRTPFQANMV